VIDSKPTDKVARLISEPDRLENRQFWPLQQCCRLRSGTTSTSIEWKERFDAVYDFAGPTRIEKIALAVVRCGVIFDTRGVRAVWL
jgi:hypothetical protein